MESSVLVKETENTPLLLRRARAKPDIGVPLVDRKGHPITPMAHMTVVTTPGNKPEMHDQEEDATRYDQDE